MRRRAIGRLAVLVLLSLSVAGCGGGAANPPTAPAARDDAAAVMAAAVRRLIGRDHTFGQGSHRFTEYLVLDHTDPGAGAPDPAGGPVARPLTPAERDAIAVAVAPFGPLRFIADADDWGTAGAGPRIVGSVILGLGAPEIAGDRALAPVSLWCGGTCGNWLTYRLVRSGGAWRVTGTEGATAIS